MKKIYIFTAITALIVSVGLASPVAVFAQYNYSNSYSTPYIPAYGACINLTGNLFVGSSDVTTGGQVSALQSFLISQRFLPIVASTGFFGALTAQAVARFQFEYGLSSDGIVGTLTRALIRDISCGGNYSYSVGYDNFNYNNNYNFNYNDSRRNCYNSFGYNKCFFDINPIRLSDVDGPTSLRTNSRGNWSLTLNNPDGNDVTIEAFWGDDSSPSTKSSSARGKREINFNHTYRDSGFFTIVFVATDEDMGSQDSIVATVNVTGRSSDRSRTFLSFISPSPARIGMQVVLSGSGFTPFGNTVHFGNGGSANINSFNNGTAILFTVPNFVNPCNLVSSFSFRSCSAPSQQIFPGTYPVRVTNSNGQTNTVFLPVTF